MPAIANMMSSRTARPRRWLGGAAFLGMAVTGSPAAAQRHRGLVDGPHVGRCVGGMCAWFSVTGFAVMRETSAGALLRVSTREGESVQPSGRYPVSSRGVRWRQAAGDTYVFCSVQRPAVISRVDGSYLATPVDPVPAPGTAQSTPHSTITSATTAWP